MRHQVERVLSRFGKSVGLTLASLPRQVIHNDANPENVLVNTKGVVSGFIDFGDAFEFLIFLTDLARDTFSRYLTEMITGVGGGNREAK